MLAHRLASSAAPRTQLPLWEWRTFDYQPSLWQEAMHDAVRTVPLVMTAETYLPTRQSPCNVKLRGELLDVKQLVRTNVEGLELWEPILRSEFPLAPSLLPQLCGLWQSPCPDVCPQVPTPEHLLSFVSHSMPDVRIVPLRKWRRRIRLHDCDGERVTILVEGKLLECLSLEHSDSATLLAALKALHLDGERNTSYLRAIKQTLGWLSEDPR